MGIDHFKLLNSVSKLKSRTMIIRLSSDELLFLSQIFHDFVSSKYPVQDFYRQRLKEYDPIIGKFARCRTFKSVRKLSQHVPLKVFATICRWGIKFYNGCQEKNKFTSATKKKSKIITSAIKENQDVKPSIPQIHLSLPPHWESTAPSSHFNSNIKQEEVSSFTVIINEVYDNQHLI